MKSILLTTLLILGLITSAQAQKTPIVLTVDMGEVYQNYEKAQEALEKFQSSVDNANTEIQALLEQRQALQAEAEDINTKALSNETSDAMKTQLQQQLQTKVQEMRAKEMEINQFRQQTQAFITDRRNSIFRIHVDAISETVEAIAKERGADMVFNTAAGTGVSSVVYSDDSFDITQECITRLNAAAAE